MALAVLALLLVLSAVAVTVLAAVALRARRRAGAAEDAVVALARSWSEDGTARGRICVAAARLAGAPIALVAEPTRRGDRLVVTACADAPSLCGIELPLDRGSLVARAFLNGTPIHAGDLRGRPAAVPAPAGVAVRSAHLEPVRHGEHVIGVLFLGWTQPHALDADRADLLSALAVDAGLAIQHDAHLALLDRQARTDELTALPNRRAWDEAVRRELARAQRTGEPLCLALLDLDHFKAFNDTHGHQAGDAHLRRTAAAWRRELRTVDVLARYGGEEFGVLLPACALEEASEVVDRVREATPNSESASAGVVAFDGRETAQQLLDRADRALYSAKRAGRAVTVPA